MKQKHQQSFQGLLVQDIDAHGQPGGTYRLSENGRVLHNRDENDPANGHSGAYTNVPGNNLVVSGSPGYTVVGAVTTTLGIVLFSASSSYAEIGLWRWDTPGQHGYYQVLYNDRYDPNVPGVSARGRRAGETGDQLHWRVSDTFDAFSAYENTTTERIYWTNRRGAMHTLNLMDAFTAMGTSVHDSVVEPAFYPAFWSVHAFRDRSDLVFPRLKFAGRCAGRLPSGAYQVGLRYRHKNGQRSVFSPLARRVFVTSNPLEDTDYNRQVALRANHHNRVMSESGRMTTEGIQWVLAGLDVRWQSVQVVVVYFQSEVAPYKIVALPEQLITGPDMLVTISDLQGQEIAVEDLNQRYESILSVGTLAVEQNRLVSGNLTMLNPLFIDTSAIGFSPAMRRFVPDDTKAPLFTAVTNNLTGRLDGDPLTNSHLTTETLQLNAFKGQNSQVDVQEYSIGNDYANNKGQLWEWLFKSYFRGETYEFGVELLDRQGQPLFVTPLAAYTFGEQYDLGPDGERDYYSLTEFNLVSGLYEFKSMGVFISGLALPVDGLYDAGGQLNVSGFQIVRRKRAARIKHQGLVFPACSINFAGSTIKEDANLFPSPAPENDYLVGNVLHSQTPGSYRTTAPALIYHVPNYLYYHSPDILLAESLEAVKTGDLLKQLGVVTSGYSNIYTVLKDSEHHQYTKNYMTTLPNDALAAYGKLGRPLPGETTRMGFAQLHDQAFDLSYKELDKDRLKMLFQTQAHIINAAGDESLQADALLERYAVLMKVKDWQYVDIAANASTMCSYRVVNYLQTPPPVAETEPYFSTGHYQPITADVLAKAKKRLDATGNLTHYVFDQVEVYGGDCYVNAFDFTRLYPYWTENCALVNGRFPDYSVSHIVPIESVYNLALRWGRSFAANAVKPEKCACEQTLLQYMNGIHPFQPEDWKYNSVLDLEEAIQFYSPKPRDQIIISERSNGFAWSPVKQAGQLMDNWRLRLVGDYGEADGEYGPIIKMVTGLFSGIYIWQTRGIGVAPLNPSSYGQGDAGLIVITSGKMFSGMVYISRKYGTQHPGSVWVHDGKMGGWDAQQGVLLTHTQAGLDEISKSKNLDDIVRALSVPLATADAAGLAQWSAATGVDAEYGEVLTTFWYLDQAITTIVYSTDENRFVGTYAVASRLYGNRGRSMWSVSPVANNRHQLYQHNTGRRGEWYGTFYPTRLLFVVNPMPGISKRFDNGFLTMNQDGIPAILQLRHWTPDHIRLLDQQVIKRGDTRMQYWKNQLQYRMLEFSYTEKKTELKDLYLFVELTIENSPANLPVHLTSFTTAFNVTP